MPTKPFDDLQIDTLTEVLNIGIGMGASVISEMVDSYISLTPPIIKIETEVKNIVAQLNSWFEFPCIGVSQEFVGDLIGSTIILFTKDEASKLVRLLLEYDMEEELYESDYNALEEVANAMINGTIGNLANIIDIDVDYEVPRFFPELITENIFELYESSNIISDETAECTLVIRTGISLDKKNINMVITIIIGIKSLKKILNLTKQKYG